MVARAPFLGKEKLPRGMLRDLVGTRHFSLAKWKYLWNIQVRMSVFLDPDNLERSSPTDLSPRLRAIVYVSDGLRKFPF